MALPHQDFARQHVMIMAAPNGARRTKDDHPQLPTTARELAECAVSLVKAGVSVLHLHVRDDDSRHTLDISRYRDAITAIRKAVGSRLILQVTSEAVGRYRADEQMNMVRELRPEAVSLALRELSPDESNESQCAQFFGWLQSEGIWPQYILYNETDVQRFENMRRRGVFGTERPHCLFVVGRYADGQLGDTSQLDTLLNAVDCSQFPWTACCFGRNELAVMCHAVTRGGHVRVGFENNLLLADGSVAGDNAALVTQFNAATQDTGRRPASAADLRNSLLVARDKRIVE